MYLMEIVKIVYHSPAGYEPEKCEFSYADVFGKDGEIIDQYLEGCEKLQGYKQALKDLGNQVVEVYLYDL